MAVFSLCSFPPKSNTSYCIFFLTQNKAFFSKAKTSERFILFLSQSNDKGAFILLSSLAMCFSFLPFVLLIQSSVQAVPQSKSSPPAFLTEQQFAAFHCALCCPRININKWEERDNKCHHLGLFIELANYSTDWNWQSQSRHFSKETMISFKDSHCAQLAPDVQQNIAGKAGQMDI